MIIFGIILCSILGLSLNVIDQEKDRGFFNFVLFMTILSSMLVGTEMQLSEGLKSKKPMKPTIKVECINNKCDTTYIYKK